jgi:hypothetical protein
VDGKPAAPLFFFGRANKYFDRLAEVVEHQFAELAPAPSSASATGSEVP